MRCSAEFGLGEIVDIEVDEWMGRETKLQKTKVWRLKQDFNELVEGKFAYCVSKRNAITWTKVRRGEI